VIEYLGLTKYTVKGTVPRVRLRANCSDYLSTHGPLSGIYCSILWEPQYNSWNQSPPSDMISVLLVGCFTLVSVTSVRIINLDQSLKDNALEINSHSNHQGKCKSFNGYNKHHSNFKCRYFCLVFPLFSVVRFANSECLSSIDQLNGTCFTRRECINYGGNPSGSCANGLGTCCVCK